MWQLLRVLSLRYTMSSWKGRLLNARNHVASNKSNTHGKFEPSFLIRVIENHQHFLESASVCVSDTGHVSRRRDNLILSKYVWINWRPALAMRCTLLSNLCIIWIGVTFGHLVGRVSEPYFRSFIQCNLLPYYKGRLFSKLYT